jgi:hypothetical protein
VFQFTNTPVVNAQGSLAGQHLADQVFQTLGRVASVSDATLTSAVKNVFDHVLAAQLQLSTAGSDSLSPLTSRYFSAVWCHSHLAVEQDRPGGIRNGTDERSEARTDMTKGVGTGT